jgi:site-specific DNA-adenine methylase
MANKLTNLTANQVQDMKTNIIDFYNNLSREVNDLENAIMSPQDNELRLKLQ